MRPVVTVEEMRAVDSAAQREVGLEVLVERAGRAAARRALQILDGAYGKRVVLVAGKGNNGADGRVAARQLARRGVQVLAFDLASAPSELPPCDLVLDAALGTGFHGDYVAPRPPSGCPVLALDVPSGLNADTGVAGTAAVRAVATVTFGAWKPGLLLGAGPEQAGAVHVEPIGLDVGLPRQHLLGEEDLGWLPPRGRRAHKWQSAVRIVAGSPAMPGAGVLAAAGAARAGSGMVRLGSPGIDRPSASLAEVVGGSLPAEGFASAVLADLDRFRALVVGPGLGRLPATVAGIRQLVAEADIPLVLDADGLNAFDGFADLRQCRSNCRAAIILTPHDGEFARLGGRGADEDRLAAVRSAAQASGATLLLKGSTTIVATPEGAVLFSASGSPRLATGGTGDVLAGVIGAFLARGLVPERAAALAAYAHGRAGGLGFAEGLVASDLPRLVASYLSGVESGPVGQGQDNG